MSEAIKLFGKTIPLPSTHQLPDQTHSADYNLLSSVASSSSSQDRHDCNVVVEAAQEPNKKSSENELTSTKPEVISCLQAAEESINPAASFETSKAPLIDRETLSPKTSTNEDQNEASISQEKTLKKPDKILPCPRCNSMDTKFCYYNNYNVNQPRHFCKNCQRYWTAGGTMRNVPVGSGRRKNKSSSASHFHHMMVSDALQSARVDVANGIHHPALKTNGTVLTFGSDVPLCESMASALKLAEKPLISVQNGFHTLEQRISVSCGKNENGNRNGYYEQPSESSITASNSKEKGSNFSLQEPVMKNFQGFPPQVPCFPGPPWPCPWNSAQWRSAVPPPALAPPAFPVSFYPAPTYWGCALPGSWSMPRLFPPSSAMSSGPNSPTLGKHSRDGNMLKAADSDKEEPLKVNNSESCVWIPKTLRIDDPSEAAKSSIWSTLGIKSEKIDSVNGRALFKAFQSKDDNKNHAAETSPVLQANPAALSRSLNFHEST